MSSIAQTYAAQAADAASGEHWSGPAELVDHLATAIGVARSDVVLDVGCGVGGPARRLAAAVGCTVVAIDPVHDVVVEARRRSVGTEHRAATGPTPQPDATRRAGAPPRFGVARAEHLPVRDGSVDHVLALGVIAHVPDLDAFAAHASRALAPGGRIAVTELLWDGSRRPAFSSSAPRPWHARTEVDVTSALARSGFTCVHVLRWPFGRPDVGDAALAEDIERCRLVPRIVVGRRPPTRRPRDLADNGRER